MNHDVYRNHYAAGAFLHVTRDGDWVILHTASGGSETTLSVPKSDAMQAAWTMSPQLDDLFTENRALRQAAYELGTCRQTHIEALRSIADEIDCGPDCDDGYVEHDTNAHVCTRENRGDDCAFYRACNLRELATALEITSALASSNASPGATEAGPLQPGSEPSGAFTPGQHLQAITASFFNGGGWADPLEWGDFDADGHAKWEAFSEIIGRNVRCAVAAPDLLEILAYFVKQYDAFRISGGNQADAYYALVKGKNAHWIAARAAIAKATPTPTLAGEGEG